MGIKKYQVMDTKKLSITKIQHVGIPTINLNKSQEFYESLGFTNVMSSNFEHDGSQGKAVMMKSGEILMEIYQLPESELDMIRQRKNGIIDHIAFDVEDIDQAFYYLKGNGYMVIEDTPVYLPFWKNGCRYFTILGPDGERIEFNQILDEL